MLLGLAVLLTGLPVEDSDFYDFYLAAQELLHGRNVYAPQPNGLQGFFNPIWGAFPFVPLVTFRPSVAFFTWRLLLAFLLGATMYIVTRQWRERITPGLLALAGWLMLFPWFLGQNAPLVAAGAFLAIVFGAHRQWWLAGTMTALLAIKPQTVPLFPLLLMWRGRLSAGKGAFLSVLLVAGAGWLVQPGWLQSWLNSRWVDSQQGGGQSWPALSPFNTFKFLHLPEWWGWVVVFASLWALWRVRKADWFTLSALTLALGTAITPYIRVADFPLLFPAFLLLPPRLRYSLLAATAVFFLASPPVPLLWFIPAVTSGVAAGYTLTRLPTTAEAAWRGGRFRRL